MCDSAYADGRPSICCVRDITQAARQFRQLSAWRLYAHKVEARQREPPTRLAMNHDQQRLGFRASDVLYRMPVVVGITRSLARFSRRVAPEASTSIVPFNTVRCSRVPGSWAFDVSAAPGRSVSSYHSNLPASSIGLHTVPTRAIDTCHCRRLVSGCHAARQRGSPRLVSAKRTTDRD